MAPLEDGVPRLDKAFRLDCDTVLLSVGLLPDNELSPRSWAWPSTRKPAGRWWTRSCRPLCRGSSPAATCCTCTTWWISSRKRPSAAARRPAYLSGRAGAAHGRPPRGTGANVRYVVPNAWQPGRENVLYLRALVVKNGAVLEVRVDGREVRRRKLAHVQPSEMIRFTLEPAELPGIEPGQPNALEVSLACAATGRDLVCIACPIGCRLDVRPDEGGEAEVTGNRCPKGRGLRPGGDRRAEAHGDRGGSHRLRRLSVRPGAHGRPLPRERTPELLAELGRMRVTLPVAAGAELLADWKGTGVTVLVTRSLPPQEVPAPGEAGAEAEGGDQVALAAAGPSRASR